MFVIAAYNNVSGLFRLCGTLPASNRYFIPPIETMSCLRRSSIRLFMAAARRTLRSMLAECAISFSSAICRVRKPFIRMSGRSCLARLFRLTFVIEEIHRRYYELPRDAIVKSPPVSGRHFEFEQLMGATVRNQLRRKCRSGVLLAAASIPHWCPVSLRV